MRNIGETNAEIKMIEDDLRKKFMERRPNEYASNLGNELLIDVLAEKISFQYENISNYSGWKGDVLLDHSIRQQHGFRRMGRSRRGKSQSSISDEFAYNWKKFTNDAFDGIDWSNIVVAGGAVLGALIKSKKEKTTYSNILRSSNI